MSYIDDYIGQYTYDYKKTYPVLSTMEHHHHITMINEDNNRYRETAYHQYIACKDYDKAITRKIQSAINSSSMIHSKQNGDDLKLSKIANKRIMIIDDDEDTSLLFKIVLEGSDHDRIKVVAFNDPFVALEDFRPSLYDLLLINVSMPNMNGFELYYRLKALDNRVKVCFLTAGEMYYETIRRDVFPDLDVNCFIRKPIANKDLIKQVKEILY
jgi:two-component system, OmpR family, response regulator ChvI